MNFKIIVAFGKNFGIGANNKLLWDIPNDLRRFKQKTTHAPPGRFNAVIMGRLTFESIGKPLPNRINIVISSKLKEQPLFHVVKSLNEALKLATNLNSHDIFIIGGQRLYAEAIINPRCESLLITFVLDEDSTDICHNKNCSCHKKHPDAFFPPVTLNLSLENLQRDGKYMTYYIEVINR